MKDIVTKIYKDLNYSSEKFSKLRTEIKEDFKIAQGKQWDDSDLETLKKQGVKGLTINKIKPIIKLITGIERQSRSDFKPFAEGDEDAMASEIAQRLLKNVSKQGKLSNKFSEQFKHGSIGGLCFLEPYIDYAHNLVNGTMKFKKISALRVFLDPEGEEYDLSDHRFLVKITQDLSKDDLVALFPDKKGKINKINNGRVDFNALNSIVKQVESFDYPAINSSQMSDNENLDTIEKDNRYDLIDYYYRDFQTKYVLLAPEQGITKNFDTKEEAEEVASQVPNSQVVERDMPVIMLAQVVGHEIMYEGESWSFPRWKDFPIFPYFFELITEDLGDKSLTIQGIVRGIKDLQVEFNKRRTQELKHINTSTSSGWMLPKGSVTPEEKAHLKKYGSSAGVVFEFDPKSGNKPERIFPMQRSTAHAALAEENAQDLKEATGVNPDLLATESKSQSGRAILLKQRQGMVMVQESLDNFSFTKQLVGRFILSQLKEIYTVETALRVVGDAYISDNFTVPVNIVLERALTKMSEGKENEVTQLEQSVLLQYPGHASNQPILDEQEQVATMVDFDSAIETINKILNDSELGKYDIAIGEGPFAETVKAANFMDLKELAQQGVSIPPSVLIEASLIPEENKKAINSQIQAQLNAQAQEGQAEMQMEDKHHTEEMKIQQQEVEVKQFLARVKAYEAEMSAREEKPKEK